MGPVERKQRAVEAGPLPASPQQAAGFERDEAADCRIRDNARRGAGVSAEGALELARIEREGLELRDVVEAVARQPLTALGDIDGDRFVLSLIKRLKGLIGGQDETPCSIERLPKRRPILWRRPASSGTHALPVPTRRNCRAGRSRTRWCRRGGRSPGDSRAPRRCCRRPRCCFHPFLRKALRP